MISTVLLVLFIICLVIFAVIYFGYPLYIIRRCRKTCDSLSKDVGEQRTKDLHVSVVIPTYNEEKVIKKKLENTLSLLNAQEKMEIIVVDDGSTDSTVNIVKNFNQNLKKKIKLISFIKNQGKPTALNVACKVARGEIIVVTDADVFISKKSMRSLISNFLNPRIGAVCGRETIINPYNNFVTRIEYHYRNFFHLIRAIEKEMNFPPLPFHGGLMAFRKRLYTDLPLDTIGDDHEIAVRIWRLGYNVIYDPNSIFLEYATQSMREIYEQKRRRSHGVIQCILKHRDLLFNEEARDFGNLRFPVIFFEFLVCPYVFFIGLASLILYTLLTVNIAVWLLTLALMLGITRMYDAIVYHAKQQWIKDIPYKILGLFIFQAAMANAVIDVLLGTSSVHWEKIEGQRILDVK